MQWNSLAQEDCSLARALAVVGDRWTMLILREAFLGTRRFDGFHTRLQIARRILTERLAALVEDGILVRIPYQSNPVRHDYRLTEKGLALYPVLLSLVHWGDLYAPSENGPPIRHRHKACGQIFHSVLTCSECGEPVSAHDVRALSRDDAKASRSSP
jgi:DNA-binding HxlR family transcriptional regulator